MRTITSLPVAALTALAVATSGCDRVGADERTERWATTENTAAAIDFDKINEAYKAAEGPEDFERRVNEIYRGSGVVSVAVHDLDAKTQVVTGFLDENGDGAVQDPEKVFTIRRDITGEGTGQYQVSGYGPSGYYHSPMMSLASGMILGSMVSSAFRPSYVPIYTQPYTTPPQRANDLRSHRDTYRSSSPSGVDRSKASGTGRGYNRVGGQRGGGGGGGVRPGGGTRFGVHRGPRGQRPERLVA
jgi:hypothetical protein